MKDIPLTGITQPPAIFLHSIRKVLSTDRLGAYWRPSMNDSEVVANYLWNMALCEALYPSLQTLEVALHNTLFDAGAATYPFDGAQATDQVPCWLDLSPTVLRHQEKAKVKGAKRRLEEKGKSLDPGRLVAELNFGFWTALFDVEYESTKVLWPRLFKQAIFSDAPSKKRSRKALSPLFDRVRHLRNRAFHHEPIWHWRDLGDQHRLALDLIGWMNPPLRRTVEAMDRFAGVHATGVEPYRAIVSKLVS